MIATEELSRFITNTEKRVESYKKLVTEAYKNGDKELTSLFKEMKQDEEKALKRLRELKTDFNAGTWTFLSKEEKKEIWQSEQHWAMHL